MITLNIRENGKSHNHMITRIDGGMYFAVIIGIMILEVEVMKNKVLMANLMLIAAAFIWGANYIFQKMVVSDIGPFTYMSLRSLLGSIVLLALSIYFEYRDRECNSLAQSVRRYDRMYIKNLLRCAPFCGVINVFGSVLVQIGLLYTTAIKAGFLTSIYIIFVPIVGVMFFKNKLNRNIILGVILATAGLYFLCVTASFSIEKGDLIILGSTLMFSLHIQLIAKYVHEFVGIHFSCIEFAFASIVCGVIGLIFENPSIAQIGACWISILFSGIFGIGVCYALQVTAQKYTNPTVAALLMSLEAVFSALLGVLILNETCTMYEFIGMMFIFVAIIFAQIQPGKKGKEI